jgi:hypothetical protein
MATLISINMTTGERQLPLNDLRKYFMKGLYHRPWHNPTHQYFLQLRLPFLNAFTTGKFGI